MFKKLLPKEDRYFELFEKQTDAIRQGLDLFERLLAEYHNRDDLAGRIKDAENRADDAAHDIFQMLNNTFVTPFDREDIQLLVNRMDDVIDMVEKASSRMVIYNMPAPPASADEMLRILKTAFGRLAGAVEMMRDWKHRESILNACVEINRLENEGDAVHRDCLRQLFKAPSDPIHVIKSKEIYESLEEAIDSCEDLANIVETILIKNT